MSNCRHNARIPQWLQKTYLLIIDGANCEPARAGRAGRAGVSVVRTQRTNDRTESKRSDRTVGRFSRVTDGRSVRRRPHDMFSFVALSVDAKNTFSIRLLFILAADGSRWNTQLNASAACENRCSTSIQIDIHAQARMCRFADKSRFFLSKGTDGVADRSGRSAAFVRCGG